MKNLFLICLVFVSFALFGQTYTVEISLNNLPSKSAYLLSIYGDENNLLDSTMFDNAGTVKFVFGHNRHIGMYRLYIDKETTVDFIFNKENIKLSCDYNNPVESMNVITSLENKLYYAFLSQDENSQRKLELLMPIINYYPKDDKFYSEASKTYNALQQNRDKSIVEIIRKNPKTYASKILNIKRTPIVEASLDETAKMKYLKDHFWDLVDFNDTLLFRSSVVTSKVLSFLILFNNRKMPQPLQEQSFIEAVDIVLPKAKVNEKMYEFILNFLMNGFENFKLESVLAHISANYKVEKCENQERKTSLQKRLESFQNLAVGKKAVQVKVPDINGKEISLDDIKTDYVLLLFWASWCPHCTQMLPEIKAIYDAQITKKLEVLTFSLDTAQLVLRDFVIKGNYTWLNCSDFKGWNSQIADDYCIYATPTMFLLDKNKMIIGKPLTTKDLLLLMKQNNMLGE